MTRNIRSHACRHAARTYRIWVCAALAAALLALEPLPALAATAAAPPRPLRVGAYYFPGWHSADRWAPIVEYGGRDPILGRYRDGLPAVQDWHIRQALQHGITFWVFDWYYDARTGAVLEHNAALDRGFLHAALRRRMDFALMWCNEEAGEPAWTREQLLRLARTTGERYLCQPNYLRAPDGRRILVISRPDRLVARFGAAGTRAVLAEMSEANRQWGGLYYVGIQDPTHPILAGLRDAGFDACTHYCYAAQGMAAGQTRAPYEAILPAVEPLWRGAKGGALPVIPCVSPGWDSRAWYGEKSLARTGASPAAFGRMCAALRQYVDPALGLMVAGTWNEFGEGTYLEPTLQRACAMLDALQIALFPRAPRHRLLVPDRRQQARLAYEDVPAFLEKQIAGQGGNLVYNPGFEREWGWEFFDGSCAVGSPRLGRYGGRALLLTRAHGGVKMHALEPGIAWPGRAANRIAVEPRSPLVVEAWVRGRVQVTLALFAADGHWLGRYQPAAEGGRRGEWSRLSAEVAITDPDATWFDFEAVPLDDGALIDDVSVRRR